MGKKASDLAMRDPALAALMGVDGMTDFGTEENFSLGGEADFGVESIFGADWDEMDGEDAMGLSSIFGVDAAAPAAVHPAHVAHPHHPLHHPNPAAQRIIAMHMKRNKHRSQRALLLEPNMHSELKIERYTFSVNDVILALGTSQALTASGAPDVNFRPEQVTINVVSPGMILITDGRVANVSFTVGGTLDAWQFNANGVGRALSVPTLTPANKATVNANYTGLVPSPLSGTGSFQFVVSFTGPATLSA